MITYHKGDLLAANVEALVNAVNTVGTMGKGIAYAFKIAYPVTSRIYMDACKRKEVQTGKMFVVEARRPDGPKWVIHFPTKRRWQDPSRFDWVVDGLADLALAITAKGIRSVAVPALGCGNGGLDWVRVRAEIERALGPLMDVDVQVFEPY